MPISCRRRAASTPVAGLAARPRLVAGAPRRAAGASRPAAVAAGAAFGQDPARAVIIASGTTRLDEADDRQSSSRAGEHGPRPARPRQRGRGGIRPSVALFRQAPALPFTRAALPDRPPGILAALAAQVLGDYRASLSWRWTAWPSRRHYSRRACPTHEQMFDDLVTLPPTSSPASRRPPRELPDGIPARSRRRPDAGGVHLFRPSAASAACSAWAQSGDTGEPPARRHATDDVRQTSTALRGAFIAARSPTSPAAWRSAGTYALGCSPAASP